jgi:hypothetical protein
MGDWQGFSNSGSMLTAFRTTSSREFCSSRSISFQDQIGDTGQVEGETLMKFTRCVTMLAIAVCVVPVAVQRTNAQGKTDPSSGTWNLDVGKSGFGKTAPPKSVRMTLTSTPTSIKWTTKTVAADGKSQTESYDGAADDRYYPIKGDPDGATFAYMKDGSSFAVKDRSGKVVETSTWSFSADGKTMTVHGISHTQDGEVKHTSVFRKAK